ncbi:MAG TPA: HRDC domain-containing protein [Candidatus Sumerlaeota bacterium]|nr:MAG: Ribonuclease D [candidate division BRC1 bacterium ADurb.Bin183]HOE64011.1 HRDC domain-containing protein [Candidatus Sumerlaeota bacterium]HRR30454.1 HRDC domain-containing protein [Candidatus Sumerlaeia bacterium]HON51080.1 HRDC domain-containing protein [Candidatus Sumerlaeota bacterium]HOR65041.1 HRDC domain-containing protein [Candidatus Sumerlaeota bacterium]
MDFFLIKSSDELKALIEKIELAPRLALDTEADSLHTYYEKICLIQLSCDGAHYIIDPLAGYNLEEFLKILSEKKLIFHSADYDLRMMRSTFGFEPKGKIFDTLLAAQILGYKHFSLSALVERFFKVTLDKVKRKSNWARRPLSIQQLQYASEDTRFLMPLADILSAELERLGRSEWHWESCERAVAAAASGPEAPDLDEIWRIKGSGLLEQRQLPYLYYLWHWREIEARMVDRPPFKIMGNQQLIQLVHWAANNPGAPLSAGPRLPRNFFGARLDALKEAIAKAAQMPPSDWPQVRRGERPPVWEPDCRPLIKSLMIERHRSARALGIEPSFLAPRSALVNIARNRPQTLEEIIQFSGLLRWQATIIEPGVRRCLRRWEKKQKKDFSHITCQMT